MGRHVFLAQPDSYCQGRRAIEYLQFRATPAKEILHEPIFDQSFRRTVARSDSYDGWSQRQGQGAWLCKLMGSQAEWHGEYTDNSLEFKTLQNRLSWFLSETSETRVYPLSTHGRSTRTGVSLLA